jgi:ribonuclease D
MHSVWFGRLRQRLIDKSHEKSKWILEGGAQDYPSYRYDVGYLAAMADALNEAEAVDREQMGLPPDAPRPTH